jgi:hypothetical protein
MGCDAQGESASNEAEGEVSGASVQCERFGAHLEVQRELVDERRREVACSADGR